MSTYKVVVIPGDGIGPEITSAVQRVLAAAGADRVLALDSGKLVSDTKDAA